MSAIKLCSSIALILLLQNTSVSAEESEKEGEQKKEVERIEVVGSKPKRFYLNEYRDHQKEFFKNFNDLVDDRDMEVVCEAEQQTGTRIRKNSCQPRFIKTLIFEETQRELSFSGDFNQAALINDSPELKRAILKEYKRFNKLTEKLLNENPELAETFVKMNTALEKYNNFDKEKD